MFRAFAVGWKVESCVLVQHFYLKKSSIQMIFLIPSLIDKYEYTLDKIRCVITTFLSVHDPWKQRWSCLSMSMFLSVERLCPSASLPASRSVRLFALLLGHLSSCVPPPLHLYAHNYVCQSVRSSARLSVCPFACLFISLSSIVLPQLCIGKRLIKLRERDEIFIKKY